MKLKWRNIPIPEACVVGIVVGGILQLLFPASIFPAAWIGHLVGWPLITPGAALSLWALAVISGIAAVAWILGAFGVVTSSEGINLLYLAIGVINLIAGLAWLLAAVRSPEGR